MEVPFSKTLKNKCRKSFKILFNFCFTFLFIKISYTANNSVNPDPKQFIVWGPGLNNKIVLPVNYFFIQTVDASGKNISTSLGADAITFTIYSQLHSHLRIQSQVLDRHDGVYIVRYKPFQTYKDLKLKVMYKNRHIAKSPYFLKDYTRDEDCHCPMKSLPRWLKLMNCPSTFDQIDADFQPFRKINMTRMYRRMMVEFDRPLQMSVVHYVVKDNKLYRETLGKYVGFKMFSDAMLLSLMRKVKLPDLDLFWNLGDWPLVLKQQTKRYPMVSWCGSDDSYDLVVPSYELTSSTLGAMHKMEKDMLSMEHYRHVNWSAKSDLAFWRGRDSSQERLKLVRLSRQHRDVLDAELTHIFFFKDEKDLKTVNSTPFFDFFKHKYQINMDGTVAAYRLSYLLNGGSLVFKQDSKYYEHYYKMLHPYVHYVPLNRDIEDLMEKLRWAKEHDEKAQQIVKNAFEFAHDNLLATNIFCYNAVFFKRYSELLVSEVRVYEGMEEVPRSDESGGCICDDGDEEDEKEDVFVEKSEL